MQHELFYWHFITGLVGGGGLVRVAIYVAKAVPTLPPNAGWWAQFGYALLKGLSGLNPNTVSLKPYDGTVDRRQGGTASRP